MDGDPRNGLDELGKAIHDARYFMNALERWQNANRDMAERFAAVIDQRNALVVAVRDLMPVACDGVDARDRDAVDDFDRDSAAAGQAAVQSARALLKEVA